MPFRERISKQLKAQLWYRDKGVCQLCRQKIKLGQLSTGDHIKPVSHGGSTVISNLRLAHVSCNRKRGAAAGPNDRSLTGGYVK